MILTNLSKFTLRAIGDAGHTLEQLDNVIISSNDVAVQAIIDTYDSLPETQAEAITEISQHANDLIDANLSPFKQKRIQSDALNASIKKGQGAILPADQAKLDVAESANIYPDAIYTQYDIEEAAILAQTDWTLINIGAAKTNLDNIV